MTGSPLLGSHKLYRLLLEHIPCGRCINGNVAEASEGILARDVALSGFLDHKHILQWHSDPDKGVRVCRSRSRMSTGFRLGSQSLRLDHTLCLGTVYCDLSGVIVEHDTWLLRRYRYSHSSTECCRTLLFYIYVVKDYSWRVAILPGLISPREAVFTGFQTSYIPISKNRMLRNLDKSRKCMLYLPSMLTCHDTSRLNIQIKS